MPRFQLLKKGERLQTSDDPFDTPFTPWKCPRCKRECYAINICRDGEFTVGMLVLPMEEPALRCTECGFTLGFATDRPGSHRPLKPLTKSEERGIEELKRWMARHEHAARPRCPPRNGHLRTVRKGNRTRGPARHRKRAKPPALRPV